MSRFSLLLAIVVLAFCPYGASATVYFLAGDPTSTGDKTVFSWANIADFETDTNPATIGTRTGAAASSGLAVTSDGTFYVLERSATATGVATLMSWTSASSYAAGDSGTTVGTTTSLGESSGFGIGPNGRVFFLEGSATNAGNRTLYEWASIEDFADGDGGIAGTDLGTRHLDPGLGVAYNGNGGAVFFLEGNPVATGDKRLLEWPTLVDFLADSNTITYQTRTHPMSSGIAIPEPTAAAMMGVGALLVAVARRRTKH